MVSRQFWIYWAVTLPVTIIVVVLWGTWYIRTVKKLQPEDEKENVDHSVFGRINLDEEAAGGKSHGTNRRFIDGKWVIMEPSGPPPSTHRMGPLPPPPQNSPVAVPLPVPDFRRRGSPIILLPAPSPSMWKRIKEGVFRRRYSSSSPSVSE
jgi:hypothetical protein